MPSYGTCNHETMTMLQSNVSSRLQKEVSIIYSPERRELCVDIAGRSIVLSDDAMANLTVPHIIDLVIDRYYK
jgi:hypothetical protein